MNILILDKCYGTKEGAHLAIWEILLKQHNVISRGKLSDLPESERDLGKYDVAIVHVSPESEDLKTIYNDVLERPNFRLLLHSGDDKYQDKAKIYESDQILYSSMLDAEQFMEAIEKGWKLPEDS